MKYNVILNKHLFVSYILVKEYVVHHFKDTI